MLSREAIFLNSSIKLAFAGAAAGAINGLFGAGGGLVLIPLLSTVPDLDEQDLFGASITVMMPICLISLIAGSTTPLPLAESVPYLLGGMAGGILAGMTEKKVPVKWLHRILGIMILWGGFRYLWQ